MNPPTHKVLLENFASDLLAGRLDYVAEFLQELSLSDAHEQTHILAMNHACEFLDFESFSKYKEKYFERDIAWLSSDIYPFPFAGIAD